MQKERPGQVKKSASLFASVLLIFPSSDNFTADLMAVLYPPVSPIITASEQFPESPNRRSKYL